MDGNPDYEVKGDEVAAFAAQLHQACSNDPVKAYFMANAMTGMCAAILGGGLDPLVYLKNAIQSFEVGKELVAQFVTFAPPAPEPEQPPTVN